MKQRLEWATTIIGIFLIGIGGLAFVYDAVHSKKVNTSVVEEINRFPGLSAKETQITIYNTKTDVITFNSLYDLTPEQGNVVGPILENAITIACDTNKYDTVVLNYSVNGKFKSTGSFNCSEFKTKSIQA